MDTPVYDNIGRGYMRHRRADRRIVQMIVDLAYKKHQKKAAGEGVETEEMIVGLRRQIAQTRPDMFVLGG